MPSLEAFESSPKPVRVLVLGGSYGGLAAALNLLDLCNGKSARFTPDIPNESPKLSVQIKVIDRRDGYYHLIGTPLALASKEFAAKAWVKFEDIVALKAPGITWAQGSVARVDPENKVATITDSITGEEYEESYDYLVASTGLRRAWPAAPQSLSKKAYLLETSKHIESATTAKDGVVVIGGGAVGIETAAELKLVDPAQKVTLVHSREKLLSSEPLPDEFKARTLSVLTEAGVEVIVNDRVMDVSPIEGSTSYRLTLKDGTHMTAGHVITALSNSIPTTTYLPREVLDSEGYVKIGSTLNFLPPTPNFSSHFAIGDLAAWSGIKRCGGAMHMGQIAAINIHQLILAAQTGSTPKLNEIPEYPPMIALAVGKKAVMYGPDDGVTYGEKEMEMMFGDDLGWSICWNYLQLGVDGTEAVQAA